jgi:hypothetical protein
VTQSSPGFRVAPFFASGLRYCLCTAHVQWRTGLLIRAQWPAIQIQEPECHCLCIRKSPWSRPRPASTSGYSLALWALGSCSLSFYYGFKRRWAETLDSYSLFQFGGDLSDQVKKEPHTGVKDFKDHDELRKLPGLIGDSKPRFTPRHITFVQEAEALKTKKYV